MQPMKTMVVVPPATESRVKESHDEREATKGELREYISISFL
jgi:hypothetical protein